MAIGMVELQGSINRTQDYQQFQHNENEKALIYQDNQAQNMDQKVDTDNNSVHNKEDAAADTEADSRERGYAGDGGSKRRRKEEKPADRIIEKKKMSFDIKI